MGHLGEATSVEGSEDSTRQMVGATLSPFQGLELFSYFDPTLSSRFRSGPAREASAPERAFAWAQVS